MKKGRVKHNKSNAIKRSMEENSKNEEKQKQDKQKKPVMVSSFSELMTLVKNNE